MRFDVLASMACQPTYGVSNFVMLMQ